MKLKISLFLFTVFFVTSCHSQSVCTKQAGKLAGIIYTYFNNSDVTKSSKNRKGPSEVFLCFLQIDSAGKVDKINLLADERNRDSAYFIFSKLQPEDFRDWKSEDCKTKTIMIPIILISSEDTPKYVSDLFGFRAFGSGEIKNLVVIKGIDLYWRSSKQ